MKKNSPKLTMSKKIGLTLLLAGFGGACVPEVISAFSVQRDWSIFWSIPNLLAIIAAVIIFLGGLIVLVGGLWFPALLDRLSVRTGNLPSLKWAVPVVGHLFVVWFFLYSPWQVVLSGPWIRSLFLLGLAQLLSVFAGLREKVSFGHREAILALGWFFFVQSIPEIRLMTSRALVYRGATLMGIALMAGMHLVLYVECLQAKLGKIFLAWRKHFGRWRFLLAVILTAIPILLLYVETRQNYMLYPYTRMTVFILALFPLAVLITSGEKTTFLSSWIAAAGLLLFSTAFSGQLLNVVNYPFSLYWSEGNRFYDYSLSFARDLYDYAGKLTLPYFSPARYALWGSLFIIPNLPIWVHRLWNALLWTMPSLVVGWLMMRRVRGLQLRLLLALWVALYLLLGAVHAPLLMSLLLFLPFMFIEDKRVRGLSLILTSIVVGLGRWTWVAGPGAWGALVDLFLYYKHRKGNFIARLWPTVALALLGVLPGLVAAWLPLQSGTSSLTFEQPLLWYRLWPNATFAPGIFFGALLATGPLLVLLVWLVATRRWKLDWIQAVAAGGTVLAFLAAGIVVSMKIGGGADLHNLDLYLVTLALLASLAAHDLGRAGNLNPVSWPGWIQVTMAAVMLVPAYNACLLPEAVKLPPPIEVQAGMDILQFTVSEYQKSGEILFMDQRQLLTFGYIDDVPFVPDYEKKYMMDQAMAGNAPYFETYYRDLADRRFSLIVTETLIVRYSGKSRPFGEENDAWVRWVSIPTLCFYRPLYTFERIGVQLLVPSPNTEACTRYLAP